MEASKKIPDAFIELNVRKQEQTPYIIITIINSCRNDPFSKQDGSLVTTKPDKGKHGFGLKSIRKTVNKYQGNMMQYYDDETTTFHTIITLKQ